MIAYIDAYSGVSGDMLLGAVIDAGLSLDDLRAGLRALPLDGYTLAARVVTKGAIGATHVRVETAPGEQSPRHLSTILSLLQASSLPPSVRQAAQDVFSTLARAEAHIHRVAIDEVHFHEVGAIDAIVDIVGVCLGFHLLGVERVYASALPVAVGEAPGRKVAHGWIPMPAPATMAILSQVGAPVVPAPTDALVEYVTPTGAALVCTLAEFRQPALLLRRVGYGAGTTDLPHPNVLRLWLGEPVASVIPPQGPSPEAVALLETNIDDMSPQVYGYLFERLLAAGALDVFATSILMKKGRPATQVSVLGHTQDIQTLSAILLRETTTLGIRVRTVERLVADRVIQSIPTPLGTVHVKVKMIDGQIVGATPEYDDCVVLARAQGRPLIDVLAIASDCARSLLLPDSSDIHTT